MISISYLGVALLASYAAATSNYPASVSIPGTATRSTILATSGTSASSSSVSCPPYDTITRTSTSTVTILQSFPTTTRTLFTTPTSLTTVSSAYTTTSYFAGGGTVTKTWTTTIPTVVASPASKTVTIETASDFIPVLCDPTYLDPVTTVRTTYIGSFIPTSYITSTETSTTVTRTVTIYTSTSTVSVTSTDAHTLTLIKRVTSTSTRDGPTSTVYAACASNNVATTLPDGRPIRGAFPTDGYIDNVPALDAVDCCALCQADPPCSGSAFDAASNPGCQLFYRNDTDTCDPQLNGQAPFTGFGNAAVSISNSACGKYFASVE